MYVFIEYLKAIATLLIANSHMKGVYPSDFLSFGGGFGLALFYMISGFLLYPISSDTKFFGWYFPKILRLYIPLWMVALIEIICGYRVPTSVEDIIWWYIFPSRWFVGSMVIMYAIFYAYVRLAKNGNSQRKLVEVVCILVLYFFVYYLIGNVAFISIETLSRQTRGIETPYVVTQLIWLCCMILGAYFKERLSIRKSETKHKIVEIVGLMMSVLLFIGVKLQAYSGSDKTQIILGPVYIMFGVTLFNLFLNDEVIFKRHLKNILYRSAHIISKCSLEIFYIQFIIIDQMKKIDFPINVIFIFFAIIVCGYMVNWVSSRLIKIIRGIVK